MRFVGAQMPRRYLSGTPEQKPVCPKPTFTATGSRRGSTENKNPPDLLCSGVGRGQQGL